jgi:hypothetical protein
MSGLFMNKINENKTVKDNAENPEFLHEFLCPLCNELSRFTCQINVTKTRPLEIFAYKGRMQWDSSWRDKGYSNRKLICICDNCQGEMDEEKLDAIIEKAWLKVAKK